MADLELTVHCRTLPNRVGFTVMCVLFPIWALIVPTCLGFLTSLLMQNPNVQSWIVISLLIGLAAIPVLSIFLTAFFEDDRLNLSKDSLSFPLFMLPWLRFRRNRSWGELTGASLIHDEDDKKRRLLLSFGNGEELSLKTSWYNSADIEQLMLSVELWGSNCARSVPLIEYQTRVQNQSRGIGTASYTQMWEEELSRRFNATSFVPLEPDHKLMKGRLNIVRQYAFGGLSAIYLAQKDEHEMVVVKEAVVPSSADIATRRKAEEMFIREAQLLVQLRHDQIARVFDHFVEDGRNYLMLEYINGQDLRQYVKQNGPQTEELVLTWGLQICDILQYLHSQNPPVVHRDLTPDNLVLRNSDGLLKLIDFGAANQFVGTATGTLVGKQAYIAPEQLRGKADLQSDIYSLGGSMYYFLTGKDPVPLAEARPKQLLPAISQELDDLVAQLTAFDKKVRIASAEVAYERLKAIASRRSPDADAVLLGGTT